MPRALLPIELLEYPPETCADYPRHQEGAYDPHNAHVK